MAISGTLALGAISINEQRKQAKETRAAQKKAAEVEGAVRSNEARKSRRQQIREARIRKAQIENTAATTGQTGSSAAIAASDSLTAKLSSNLGSIQQALASGSAQTIAQQDIFEAERPSNLGLASNLGVNIFASKI